MRMTRMIKTMMHSLMWMVIALVFGHLSAQGRSSVQTTEKIESLIRSHQYETALQTAKIHLRVSPSDHRCLTLEGIILSMQGRNAEALAAYSKALKISPQYGPALRGEAQLLYQKDDQLVIPVLQKILAKDPHDLTAHEMLAVMERRKENCKVATEQFILAGDEINAHQKSLEDFGYCLVENRQWQDAVSVFQKLRALDPQATYPIYDLAVIYVALKQNQAAVEVLASLLKPEQKDTEILSLASAAYEGVGNTPRAVELLRRAIVLSPTTPEYYLQFAALCFDHDSFEVGIDMMNVGIQRLPENANLYLSRGLFYVQLAKFDKAEEDFGRAERFEPKESFNFYAVDLAEMERNRPDNALAKVREQLKALPNSPFLNLLLARLIMNQEPNSATEPYNEAMHAILLAIQEKPDLVEARDLLASMDMESGNYDQAIEQSRLALQCKPTDEAATYHLLISLRHKGEKNEFQMLSKRLTELHLASLKAETDRKRFRLVEPRPPIEH